MQHLLASSPPARLISRTPNAYREHAGDRQFATTLARGMELLRCFTPEEPTLSNKELAQRMALPAATICRLSYTLVCMGYLVQDESHGRYRLGSSVLSLGYPFLQLFTMRQRARPLMLELAIQTGGVLSIGIRDRLNIVFIEVIRNPGHISYPLDVGAVHSMAGTALGRTYLAASAPAERDALLNQIRVKSPKEWERNQEALVHNLALYPKWGCCTAVGDMSADVQAVAVPLGRVGRGELATLNCAFQGRALNEAWLRETIAPKLLSLARLIA